MTAAKEFSERIRRNPIAKSPTALERVKLGMARILSVLDKEEVAEIRTLEAKIADAGPHPKRVEPHIIGYAGIETLERNRVKIHRHPLTGNHNWYAPARFSDERIADKLDQLVHLYAQSQNAMLKVLLGDALEISVFNVLTELRSADPSVHFFGQFDLSQRKENGRFKKTEPPTNFSGEVIDGPPDFLLVYRSHLLAVECKNYREWIYPSSQAIKDIIRKAATSGTIPVLIARRMPFITKRALCEPAGIIAHETYNQLYPDLPQYADLVAELKKPRSLGYFDIKASHEPLDRTRKFFMTDLPKILPTATEKFMEHRDRLLAFATGDINWTELQRHLVPDYDGPDIDVPF